jgi:hypothetical protein
MTRVICPACNVGHSENLDDPWYYENEDGFKDVLISSR